MVGSHRFLRLAAAGLLAAGVAACGGGGGSPGTPSGGGVSGGGGGGGGSSAVTDKYIGTWVRCLVTGGSTAQQDTLVLNKSTDTSMVFSDTLINYNNTTCVGTGAQQAPTTGNVTWVGSKSIGSETVDEITIQTNGVVPIAKQVIEIRTDTKLYLGDTTSTVDANGYPNAIDPNGFTKH